MKIGQTIEWGAIESLGLPAFEHSLPDGSVRREIRVYRVPEVVDASRYVVTDTEAGGVEEVPYSRVRETDLLVHFTLQPDGEALLVSAREEVRRA